jgi:hypothetical protein
MNNTQWIAFVYLPIFVSAAGWAYALWMRKYFK